MTPKGLLERKDGKPARFQYVTDWYKWERECVQDTRSAYSLYSDYFWYEIGDMISVSDGRYQYYCFPVEQEKAIVAKARLATEELYKLTKEKKDTFCPGRK